MALATVGGRGAPSVRFVLLKGADRRGFVFFTDGRSRKGRELRASARAAVRRKSLVAASCSRPAAHSKRAGLSFVEARLARPRTTSAAVAWWPLSPTPMATSSG